ncbi:MAG: hypothetical protein NVSMB49_18720 [Ktedonobacteraceae bacterium]
MVVGEDFAFSQHDDAEEHMSADDLAILQAFDAKDTWQKPESAVSSLFQEPPAEFTNEDMVLLFTAEVDEDITQMKQALSQLEQDDTLDMTRFTSLRQIAHKIRGSAGVMECHAMATIAHHIEDVVAHIHNSSLFPLVGLNALVQAVLALEVTLQDFLTNGRESDAPLLALEHELEQLNTTSPQEETAPIPSPLEEQDTHSYLPLSPSIHIEPQRFERILRDSEQLVEMRTPLENAQAQVETALHELHVAQRRLQQLEHSLLELARPAHTLRSVSHHPSSSLVERMLKEATPQGTMLHGRTLKLRTQLLKTHEKAEWDELEFERYSDRDRAVHALRTAIAQVTVAFTHIHNTYDRLHEVTQRYVLRATDVYTHLHLLRLTPLSVLLPRLQRVLATYAPDVAFKVIGETTEIDQDILDTLASPLTNLLRTCVTTGSNKAEDEPQRVWLSAQALGNEVTLEFGFSMTVQGGTLDAIHPFVQQLGGTVELQRNTTSGVSFFLRFPRSQGTVHGLLVRVSDQQVVIPFSQVHRVGNEHEETLDIVYHLYKLLNFPFTPDAQRRVTPIIVLPQGRSRLRAGIIVDDVISDVEVVVKPLASYLQRPGIAGTVLDSKGNVLLLLDIPELLKYYTMVRRHMLPEENDVAKVQKTQRLALIADDSTLFRKSLVQTLTQAKYATVEAGDGLEALDLLTQNPPDVFLLDIEMPNLSGYDLLSIMHIYPELNDVKVVILSSRITEKHKQRALELGAHTYLTKPCPADVLLATIEELLH